MDIDRDIGDWNSLSILICSLTYLDSQSGWQLVEYKKLLDLELTFPFAQSNRPSVHCNGHLGIPHIAGYCVDPF